MPAEVAKQEIIKLPQNERPERLMRIGHPSPHAIAFFARKCFFQIALRDPRFVIRAFVVENPKHLISQLLGLSAPKHVITPK